MEDDLVPFLIGRPGCKYYPGNNVKCHIELATQISIRGHGPATSSHHNVLLLNKFIQKVTRLLNWSDVISENVNLDDEWKIIVGM